MIPLRGPQNEPFERIGEGFRSQTGSSESAVLVLAVVGAVAVAAVLVALAVSSRRGGPARALFRELARASDLTGPESRLLLDLALRVQPDDPPAIFVRRSAFESAAVDAAPEVAVLDVLRRKLYGP